MKFLTDRKAVLSLIGASFAFAVPIMVDKKPGELTLALKPWLPAFYSLAGFLVIYAVAAFSYERGRKSEGLNNDLKIAIEPTKGRTIKDLIYAANQIASVWIGVQKGPC